MCYIYNGQSERENKKHPSRVHFLLQKNTGNDERQIMTLKEVVGLAFFSCHQPKAEDDYPEPTQKSERIKHTMDYESFKKKFVEDLKDRLDEQGADVKVSVNTVNNLNNRSSNESFYDLPIRTYAEMNGIGYENMG